MHLIHVCLNTDSRAMWANPQENAVGAWVLFPVLLLTCPVKQVVLTEVNVIVSAFTACSVL